MTKLTDAIKRQDVAEVKRLITEEHVDVDELYRSDPGRMPVRKPPFLFAAETGNVQIGRMLKEAGADLNAVDSPLREDAP